MNHRHLGVAHEHLSTVFWAEDERVAANRATIEAARTSESV
jgi:hypothetical protein